MSPHRRASDAEPTADQVASRGVSSVRGKITRLDGTELTLTARELHNIRRRLALGVTSVADFARWLRVHPSVVEAIRDRKIFSKIPEILPTLGLDDVRTEGVAIHERWEKERRKDER